MHLDSDLDLLLSELKVGPIDSSGVFQVDLERFRQEMQRHLRQMPHTWLIKAVQLAFTTQPLRFDIQVSRDQIVLAFEPTCRCEEAMLQRAVRGFLAARAEVEPQDGQHLKHLLWLLTARPDLRMTLSRGCTELTMDAEGPRLRQLSEPAQTRLTFARGAPATRFELDSPVINWHWPEWSMAHQTLALPLAEMTLNGRPWHFTDVLRPKSTWPAVPRKFCQLFAIASIAEGSLPRPWTGNKIPWTFRVSCDAQGVEENLATSKWAKAFCWLSLGSQQVGRPPHWYILQDGYVIDEFPPPPGLHRIEAYVEGNDLKVDASFLRAVRDQAWEDRVEWARGMAHQFLRTCKTGLVPLLRSHSSIFDTNGEYRRSLIWELGKL